MDRKTYMRDVYSKYWLTAREKRYGFLPYDKNLCKLLSNRITNGSSLLDIGVGTGFPFAVFFSEADYTVHGVDISPALIERCRELYPKIKSKVGDAENLDYSSEFFDAVYCFHSTWYFPDLMKVLDQMLRVTKKTGIVVFDIQNRNNEEIELAYQSSLREKSGIGMIKRQIKNLAKTVLRRGSSPVWRFLIYEVPTYPDSIYTYCKTNQITSFEVFGSGESGSLVKLNPPDSFPKYGRLVFVLTK